VTLRTALVIDGDASGGKKAAEDTQRAIEALAAGAKKATDEAADGFKKIGTAGGAANDNLLSQTSDLLKKFGELTEKVRGSESAIAKLATGGSAIAQSAAGFGTAAGAIGLVTAGLGLAATAAGVFYNIVKKDGDDATRLVTEHARLMGVLRGAYDEAGQSASLYGQKVSAVAKFQAEINLAGLRTQLGRLNRDVLSRATQVPDQGLSDGGMMPPGTAMAMPQVPQLRAEFEAFAGAVAKFQAGGAQDIVDAREEISRIALAAKDANPQLFELAKQFLQSSDEAGKVASAIVDLVNALQGKFSGPARQTVNEFDRMEKSLRRQAAAQEAEAEAVGRSAGEQARLRTQMLLLEAAQQAGIKVDEARQKSIDALAERFGKAAQRAAELRLQSDASFERSQIGRDPIEASVASQLRGVYGDSYRQEMDGTIASYIRTNEQLRITKDLILDVGSTFRQTLRAELEQGADGWEAFSRAGLRALERIEDKLMDMVLNQAISKIVGGGGLNIFGLFGGGSSSPTPTFTDSAGGWAGGGGWFDKGGYTGRLPRNKIAGFVHGDEFVIKAEQTAKHFELLSAINEGRFKGFAGGGFTGDVPPSNRSDWPASGAPQVVTNLKIENNSGQEARVSRQRNASGGEDFHVIIGDVVAGLINSGTSPVNQSMERAYGLDPTRGML